MHCLFRFFCKTTIRDSLICYALTLFELVNFYTDMQNKSLYVCNKYFNDTVKVIEIRLADNKRNL